MNLKETIELLSALKSAGATHFKSADFEVTLSAGSFQIKDELPTRQSQDDGITLAPSAMPADVSTVHNLEATAKVKDLIQTLSMPNDQLIDKIFPNGAGG